MTPFRRDQTPPQEREDSEWMVVSCLSLRQRRQAARRARGVAELVIMATRWCDRHKVPDPNPMPRFRLFRWLP